ncbi:methylmalonyl Co-A mutase-associated GTPase MeaB [Thermoplasmatales archaeon AK]|nr:methylmalonyl Co-A mutase-associated GTPase MeaB [Thermoplasmatales archaeon AK]
MDLDSIIHGIRSGDRRAISRAISIVEGEDSRDVSREIIRSIYPFTGNAHVLGITGPPGIGKSTMLGRLSELLHLDGLNVSVLAIDASSPFSGGTLLGNRIRMQESLTRNGIYMRSLANRGAAGGISRSAWDAVKILDASGCDLILLETVGAGQADLEISKLAHTVMVVLGPGLGDEIQALKSGLMEIGQIFVVNKMDLPGAFAAVKDLQETLAMDPKKDWPIPVIGVSSLTGEGFPSLIDTIKKRIQFVNSSLTIRTEKMREEIIARMTDELVSAARSVLQNSVVADEILNKGSKGVADPYEAVESILKKINLHA